jgi:uncharacterized protein (TIGR04255 family)
MPFPEFQNLHYNKSPLDRVVCQIRFPTILKIDSQTPVDFQEKVRSEYPQLEVTSNFFPDLGSNLGQLDNQEINQLFRSAESKNYSFSSRDDKWKITLTKSYLTLTTTKYNTWSDFIEKEKYAFNSLNETYNPTLFTRVGLRYIDVIKRSTLNLNDTEWKDLFKEYISGVFSVESVNKNILAYENACRVNLENDKGNARIICKTVTDANSGEPCFLLDFDLFKVGKFNKDGILSHLDFLHSKAFSIFRWCITDKLHNAMEPR